MDFYAYTRTYDLKGVNIPSQKRYVEYFSEAFLLHKGTPPLNGQVLKLKQVKMNFCPKNGISNFGLVIKDIVGNTLYHYVKSKEKALKFKGGEKDISIQITKCCELSADIHFSVSDGSVKFFC
jgi:hypothetical protein